ncbi:MAG: tetratricopeptide repeat protein [Microscillaceae bacterium]|nr:tetratricopeptide repeat protein [Microscillaceae bacterium]
MKQHYLFILIFLGLIFLNHLPVFSQDSTSQKALNLLEEGQLPEALQYLENALRAEKENALLYYARGRVLLQMGETRQALSDFKKSTKLNKQIAELFFYQAVAQDSLNKLEEALQDYNRAIRLDDKQPHYYVARGHLFYKAKDYQTALSNLNYALQMSEQEQSTAQNGYAYYLRALTKYFLVDTYGACKDWREAYKLGYEPARTQLEQNCREIGD